ncbi:HNH endonuclease [Photobacterium damselae]|uniref:HNH endonuclease n=1 Tax=Photobacterium damselae TaxID=38293 RepID=UPI0010FD4153|nr:HNH endonuclease [Photobacterium damselae]TLS80659.1 HNH endonuclease [Photobacterium damselae subsp. damselae]
MESFNCIYCDNNYFEKNNGSVEHAILSAIGGRKVSKNICCIDCNKRFGRTIDAQFAGKLRTLCGMLGIQKDRKEIGILKGVVKAGEDIADLHPDGKMVQPNVSKDVYSTESRLSIHVTAGTEEQAMQISKGLLKKHGHRIEDAVVNIEEKKNYVAGTHIALNFKWNEDDLRCVAKMALTYLVTITSPTRVRSGWFDDVINFINGSDSKASDFVYMDTNNVLPERPMLSPTDHRIFLYASKDEHLCMALLELFGTFTYSILLSKSWDGPDIAACYVIDPITTNREEKKDLVLPVLSEILNNRGSDDLMVKSRLNCLKLYLEAIDAQR